MSFYSTAYSKNTSQYLEHTNSILFLEKCQNNCPKLQRKSLFRFYFHCKRIHFTSLNRSENDVSLYDRQSCFSVYFVTRSITSHKQAPDLWSILLCHRQAIGFGTILKERTTTIHELNKSCNKITVLKPRRLQMLQFGH